MNKPLNNSNLISSLDREKYLKLRLKKFQVAKFIYKTPKHQIWGISFNNKKSILCLNKKSFQPEELKLFNKKKITYAASRRIF